MPELNEVTAAANEAKRVREAADARKAEGQGQWPVGPIGIGLGIGSAAIAAALLYVNHSRRKR